MGILINNITATIAPAASPPFFPTAKEPPKKLGFLISCYNVQNHKFLSERPHLLEGRYIAEHNKGVAFDCMHTFDPLHISTFLSEYESPAAHRRIALHIIRIFDTGMNVDDIIDTFLKPAFEDMVKSGKIYNEMPGWLNELRRDYVVETTASVQDDLLGNKKMLEEFAFIKRKLLGCSNKISAEAFKQFLKENPDITEVYGFIDQVNLYFLNEQSTITSFDDTQRHLIFKLDDREVPVHLFGTDDTPAYRDGMRLFALEQGLRIPYDHEDEMFDPKPSITGYEKIVKAFGCFKDWWDRCEHYSEDHQELVDWLHEDETSEKFIHTYQDFVQLVDLAKTYDFNIAQIPDEKTFDAAIQLRQAKKLQSLENTDVFPKELSLEERLANAKKIYDLWMKSTNQSIEAVEGNQNDPRNQLPANAFDKKSEVAALEAINMAMEIIFSKRKRREKPTEQSFDPVDKSKAPANDIETIRAEIEKITASRVPALTDLLPVTNNSMTAPELSATLKKYLELIRLAQEALVKFNQRQMDLFDPLVGENSCQIRATMFTEILSKPDIDEMVSATQRRLAEHAVKIKSLLDKLPAKSGQMASCKSFLQQNKALLEISEEIAIIISSFILTEKKIIEKENKFGDTVRTERSSSKILSERKGISGSFAAALIKAAQKLLSRYSAIYVQRLAFRMFSNKEERSTAKIAFNNVKKDILDRSFVPFYHGMRVLLNNMYENGTPLVLNIKQYVKGESTSYDNLTLVFGNQGKGSYSLVDNPTDYLKKFAVIFNAKSITEKEQSKEDLIAKVLIPKVENLILSASADHTEINGWNDDSLPNDPLFLMHRQKALEWGACYANPSVLMVQHVCCGTVEQKMIEASPIHEICIKI